MSRRDHNKGQRDGSRGKHNPPKREGVVDIIFHSIFGGGPSTKQENKREGDYNKGNHHGRKQPRG